MFEDTPLLILPQELQLRVHSQGALRKNPLVRGGCNVPSWIVHITEVFQFGVKFFILPFSVRKFFKKVDEPIHISTLHHKLISQGALKKAFVVPEYRSYQTQYFSKIFPSPLNSTLLIHFYLHLNYSALNSHIYQNCNSLCIQSALKTAYCMLFLKTFAENLEKKLVIILVFILKKSLNYKWK